ncbi:MAG: nucleoside recognition domain-containing protein [Desulfotignum sp.]|nr:nucleoside recognition domain-containing protein [Desulfotignum sp.]
MTQKNNPPAPRLFPGIRTGLKKGWNGFVWLLKIIVPVSFATGLLVYSGLIYKLDFLLTPVMSWLGLPAAAALVIIAGIFTGIYGTVAALSVMPFSMDHMILLAVFTLICHNLIQESIVQGRSGINPFFAAAFRLAAAFVVTFCCAKIMGITPQTTAALSAGTLPGTQQAFSAWLAVWAVDTLKLTIQIFFIIMPLMVMLELARIFHVIDVVIRPLRPVLSFLGLDKSCGMLWMTAAVFGLAYGSAVIVEETRTHFYDKEALTRLHLSIGINHAMIEDPVLLLPLGIPPFWLWIPRLVAAIIVTYTFSVFSALRRQHAQRTGHKKIRHY